MHAACVRYGPHVLVGLLQKVFEDDPVFFAKRFSIVFELLDYCVDDNPLACYGMSHTLPPCIAIFSCKCRFFPSDLDDDLVAL